MTERTDDTPQDYDDETGVDDSDFYFDDDMDEGPAAAAPAPASVPEPAQVPRPSAPLSGFTGLPDLPNWTEQDYSAFITGSGANKGGAVRAFMAMPPFAGATPMFVGDDLTDEDGMIACNEAGGFGVLVGDRSPTSARFRLPDVPAVYQWLNL